MLCLKKMIRGKSPMTCHNTFIVQEVIIAKLDSGKRYISTKSMLELTVQTELASTNCELN